MMRFSIVHLSIVILFALALAVGCSTSSGPDTAGGWQQEGLPDIQVNTIQTKAGMLFAGTDRGVFKRSVDPSNDSWIDNGMNLESSKVVDLVIWSREKLLTAIKYDEVRTDKPTLFKSIDGGNSWAPMEINKPEELNYFAVKYLEKHSEDLEKVVAYVGRIVQSEDSGETWNIIYDEGGFSKFLRIDDYHPNHIWTGGWTTIFSPYLAKSEDGGKTWTRLDQKIYNGSDGTTQDVILHPDNPDRILVAMGTILRTNDGGQTWEDVPAKGMYTSTFTHSDRDPEMIYAGGFNMEKMIVFAQTPDFGDTWELIEYEESPADIWVNDLAVVEADGREVLYFATNKGVFSFTFIN